MAQALASMEDDHAALVTQSVQRTIKVEPILRLPSPPPRRAAPRRQRQPACTLGPISKTLYHRLLYPASTEYKYAAP